ncbi:MAG TPA: nuclear transport factor 2 family protein, partial [candidate division Zixibacteria bacterium]|nr:nuclear transport factor 2 family protein [candidate division Zixibacteria bacterium]
EERIDFEAARESMINADEAFSLASVEEGMRPAFDRYMAENATIYRDRMEPITGREEILSFYPPPDEQEGILSWEPFYAEIAESGELGYTLGKWIYTVTDTLGMENEDYGYYVTIWKKQPDGSWKYVFDTGITGPEPDEEIPEDIPEE